jgi:hypothetical protein
MMESYDYGVSKLGTSKKVFIEDGMAISKITFNAAPYLKRAKDLRDAQENMRWGEGKVVGVIPEAVLNYLYQNSETEDERQKASIRWLSANPAYITYPAYFKPKTISVVT